MARVQAVDGKANEVNEGWGFMVMREVGSRWPSGEAVGRPLRRSDRAARVVASKQGRIGARGHRVDEQK